MHGLVPEYMWMLEGGICLSVCLSRTKQVLSRGVARRRTTGVEARLRGASIAIVEIMGVYFGVCRNM